MKAAAKIGHGRPAKVRTGLVLLLPGFPSSLSPARKENLSFYRQKGKKSSFRLLGGPQHFDEGVAPISRADWTRTLPSLYFLAWSHLRVTTEVLKCFRGKPQATRTPQTLWTGSMPPAPRAPFQNPRSLVMILAAALSGATLPKRPGPSLSLSSSFEEWPWEGWG